MATAASRSSSFWVKAAVVAVLAAACAFVAVRTAWSDDEAESADRAAVREYIVSLNTTQQAFALELDAVNDAYGTLRLGARQPAGQEAKLERAERALRSLRSRLAALPAPRSAGALRAEVLELADLHVAFAAEVAALAGYVSFQAAEGSALVAATDRLERGLEDAATGAAQRERFTEYAARIRTLAGRLAAADAPDVLEPGRSRQVERLRELARISSELGTALEAGDAERANALFEEFGDASATAGTTKADQAAVRAYNARIAAIVEQRAAVEAERRKLSASS